jgi:hypothetical protein
MAPYSSSAPAAVSSNEAGSGSGADAADAASCGTDICVPHALQLARFPANWSATLYRFPHPLH